MALDLIHLHSSDWSDVCYVITTGLAQRISDAMLAVPSYQLAPAHDAASLHGVQ